MILQTILIPHLYFDDSPMTSRYFFIIKLLYVPPIDVDILMI